MRVKSSFWEDWNLILDFFTAEYKEMCDSFINNPVAQAIGFVSLILSLASFQMKRRGGILFLQMLASFTCAISLVMLGGISGGILDLVAFSRTLVFSLSDRYKWAKSRLWLPFYFTVIVAVGIITWDTESIGSLFAILGTLLSTVALYMKKERLMRIISLFVGPCWVVYGIIYSSCFGILNEIIAMASIVIALIRLKDAAPRNDEIAQD